MLHVARLVLPAAFLVGALAPAAPAGDYYVDVLHGDNANAGTSPASAWRNVSYAAAQVPSPPTGATHVVHVAPGAYDAASGESFALVLRTGIRIVGDAGSAATVIDGAGSGVVLAYVEPLGSGWLEGLTLQDAGTGVVVGGLASAGGLTLRDVRILRMHGAGVEAIGAGSYRLVSLELDHVRVQRCYASVYLTSTSDFGDARLTAVDCQFVDGVGLGIGFLPTGHHESGTLSLVRCLVAGNGGTGVYTEPPDGCCLSIGAVDTAIVDNGGDGVDGSVALASGVSFSRCTIARNGAAGVRSGGGMNVWISSSIVHGNGDDLVVPAALLHGADSDVGDGDLVGTNVITADPRFRDPAHGDYRLAWDSPCVDTGAAGVAAGTPDRSGTLRPIDGDLDAVERCDMGAYELAPLALAGVPHAGGVLDVELLGPALAHAGVYVARGALVLPAATTPYGELDLNPATTAFWRRMQAATGPPGAATLPLPAGAGAIGRTFALQALVSAPAAPAGAAWTNAAAFTIVP